MWDVDILFIYIIINNAINFIAHNVIITILFNPLFQSPLTMIPIEKLS